MISLILGLALFFVSLTFLTKNYDFLYLSAGLLFGMVVAVAFRLIKQMFDAKS